MRIRCAIVLGLVATASFGARAQQQARRFELDDLARVVRLADPQIAPDGRTIAVVLSRANLEEDRWESQLAIVDVASGRMRPLTYDRRGAGQPRWSPAGDRLGFLATVGSGRD